VQPSLDRVWRQELRPEYGTIDRSLRVRTEAASPVDAAARKHRHHLRLSLRYESAHIVMEFVEGSSLRSPRCDGEGAPEIAAIIAGRSPKVWSTRTTAGIVHRDIKP